MIKEYLQLISHCLNAQHLTLLLQLPDYHDIIKNPMDFGTVRKKLDGELYTDLEHFEVGATIFCSNSQKLF